MITPMGAKPEPAPEPQPPAEPAADDKSEPEPTTRGELEVATRSARSALITAVAAAVISSFVAAGSAVYVSINQSNRSETLAMAQALRQDRQKVYRDFSVALFTFTQQLGNLIGVLAARGSVDSARPEITELSRRQGEFLAGLNLLLMAGRLRIQPRPFGYLRGAIHRGQRPGRQRRRRLGAGIRGLCGCDE